MTVRLAAGALAATCSVILLASCSSGSQSGAGQSAPAAAKGASSSMASMSSMPSGSSMASSGGPASASTKQAAAKAKITIKNFKYQVPASVKPGQQVIVTNTDNVNHTVTSDKSGLFDAKVDSNGGTKTFTAPSKPGKYPFHCTYHANMHGTLVVS